jgi:hypothetical protein
LLSVGSRYTLGKTQKAKLKAFVNFFMLPIVLIAISIVVALPGNRCYGRSGRLSSSDIQCQSDEFADLNFEEAAKITAPPDFNADIRVPE